MASLVAAREALARQVQDFTGLNTLPYAPEQINSPQAFLVPGQPYFKFGQALGEPSLDFGPPQPVLVPTDIRLIMVVAVSRAGDSPRAQRAMDEYLGLDNSFEKSVPRAIMSDPTLGGKAEWVVCVNVPVIQDINIAGTDYYHARINLDMSLSSTPDA